MHEPKHTPTRQHANTPAFRKAASRHVLMQARSPIASARLSFTGPLSAVAALRKSGVAVCTRLINLIITFVNLTFGACTTTVLLSTASAQATLDAKGETVSEPIDEEVTRFPRSVFGCPTQMDGLTRSIERILARGG